MVASEYGYTFDDFLNLNYRQLYGLMERIALRKHNNFMQLSILHGNKKPKFKKLQKSIEELSVDHKEIMAKAIKKAAERKIAERHKSRMKGSGKE